MTPDKGSILITGASSGIGRTCALMLDRAGYQVFAGVRTLQALEELSSLAPGRIRPVMLDITDAILIRSACQTIDLRLEGKGLTALINNAGITLPGSVEFLSLEGFRRELEVNVIGHLAVTQAFLPWIRKGKGRIINVGSALGKFVMPLTGAYAASKFALEALTDSLRRELLPSGIYVSLVAPGSVESAIWDKIDAEVAQMEAGLTEEANARYGRTGESISNLWKKAHRRAIPPEAVAEVVLKILESSRPESRYPVGPDAHFLSIVGRFAPDSLVDWVVDKIVTLSRGR
ncbi:MAG: SDR family oxidoreductase [Deltaproteobacteria bacterium]|nr:SDR family oxidoreductase [Deltaproteobacteria bacterium]